MEKYDEALEDFGKALELDSTSTAFINDIAVIYYALGKTELAIKEMEKLIKIKKEDPLYYGNNALYYSKIDQFDKALENYTKAIELETENKDEYYINRASVYEKMYNWDSAWVDYIRAIELILLMNIIIQEEQIFCIKLINMRWLSIISSQLTIFHKI